MPVAGHHEQLAEAAVERLGHRLQPELGDRGGVDLDGALEARLLGRLEADVVDPPAAVVVRASQRGVQLADLDLDPELAEGDRVHRLPRGIRPHDGVADVEEDGAQRPGLIGHGVKRSAVRRIGPATVAATRANGHSALTAERVDRAIRLRSWPWRTSGQAAETPMVRRMP